ncbi:hypothetical protein [Sutcliffiella horikoshii]|uniref:hypothetical protein n=1 Tax=Sutcliffiella horikoshii TaxID=79883 RepID=UPI001F349958|nr:hypothetical protein [Sutcliffiella horikoshii]MCG1023394.1 hypothetical protein [Sutcliffiella horikoshii]
MKQSNDFQSLNQKIAMSDKEQERVQAQINHKMNASPMVRKSSTPRKYYVALASAALIFMLILIPAIFNNLEKPSDSVVVADEIPPERLEEILAPYEYNEILHVEEVTEGVVVFFTRTIKKDINIDVLHATFIKKTKYGWDESTEGAEHTIQEKEDLSHQLITPGSEESPFPLVFGKILNPDISSVLVRMVERKQEYPAEIIVSENGSKYWFTFAEIDREEIFEIHGLNKAEQAIYSIDTLYGNGESPELLEANPNAENFELSAEELEIYERLKVEYDTQLLIGLSPISIAKFYVQAAMEEERELQYEFYTDRQDMMQIDKEEYLSEMGHSSLEQIRNTFFGIQDGIFHDNGDSGYISYMNIFGQEWGFQMVKEEDGSWAVAFMPLQ